MFDILSETDLTALILTFKLAAITTVLLLIICVPLAWWLSRMKHPVRVLLEAFLALPLVLPPTVLGFYLLIFFAPDSFLGKLWESLFSVQLAFSFEALVIGSMIYSLPFVVQPLQQAFSKIPMNLLEVYSSMGLSLKQRISYLILPLTKSSLVAAMSLGFAHTIGEFGVVLMIGGNIPGETQVISLALYDHVESLNYAQAHAVSGMLILLSMIILILTYAKIGSPLSMGHYKPENVSRQSGGEANNS